MIDLRPTLATLSHLVRESLASFEREHPRETWSAIGLDSSPVYGFARVSFDTEKNSDRVVAEFSHNGLAWYGEDPFGRYNNNCADFQFWSYREIQFPSWEHEFFQRNDHFTYVNLLGTTVQVDMGVEGNEGFNRIVFEVFKEVRRVTLPWVAKTARNSGQCARFGIQMCDSECVEFVSLPMLKGSTLHEAA